MMKMTSSRILEACLAYYQEQVFLAFTMQQFSVAKHAYQLPVNNKVVGIVITPWQPESLYSDQSRTYGFATTEKVIYVIKFTDAAVSGQDEKYGTHKTNN